MTCSSSTICTTERWRWVRLSTVAVALGLALAPLAGHAEPEPYARSIAAARDALSRGDGVDAEMKARAALHRGAPRAEVSAYLGEAYLDQGDLDRARTWLGSGDFAPDTRLSGLRALARLERDTGDLAAAAKAYDRALAIAPRDAGLWVEIGRLRYVAGEHLAAIAVVERAVALDPANVRALEFRGELVRDRYGLLAAIPWFEAALMHAPSDVSVLTQYAATLGELGRASECLVVTRRILQLSPGNPQAFYLQAVIAARAGDYELARGLMARTKGKLGALPGVLMLQGVLELAAGNTRSAAEALEQVLSRQPDNLRAKELLARALFQGKQFRYLTLRFRGDIAAGATSPYLLTMVARGYEAVGDRAAAGVLLDRAAAPQVPGLRVVGTNAISLLLAKGQADEAASLAQQAQASTPGMYDTQSLAGDAQFARGDAAAAAQRYADAARVRMSESLLLRRFAAYHAMGDGEDAAQMVDAYLLQNPTSRVALRLAATLAVAQGDASRAGSILDYLRRSGGGRDVQLLCDLALVQDAAGEAGQGEASAEDAYRLQRANPTTAQVLGLSYATLGLNRQDAAALLDKARRMLGANPMIAEARARLRRTPG